MAVKVAPTEYVYKYEHTNGQILTKPRIVVESGGMDPLTYFDSPFVKRWWRETLDGKEF